MSFAEPHYLIALWAVPLIAALAILAALRKRNALSRMGDPGLLGSLAEGYSPDRRGLKTGLTLVALACAILAAARPQVGWQLTRGAARGIDLAIALDVSASMLAEDIAPSRLERAKSELAALISEMEGSRVSIVAFAGSAATVCPLTADYRAAMMFLDALQWGVVDEDGTDIGKAIDRALRSFDSAEDRSRAVLIVSDGEDHKGGHLEAARRAAEAGVPVYCVGLGGEAGVPIPVDPEDPDKGLRRDSEGRVVLSSMNGRVLSDVSYTANGSIHVLGPSGGSLRGLESDLKALPRRERPTTYTHRGERFHALALLSLCLLALDWVIGERRKAGAALAALVLGVTVAASAAGATTAGDAVKLYNRGDYLGALARFREALGEDPSPPLHYDVANSLYRLEKYDEAVRQYWGAIGEADSSLEMRARYNMGNALFKGDDMQGAVEQYIEALKLNPDDGDAKHNLELALRRLQQSGQSQRDGKGGESGDAQGEGADEPEEKQDADSRGGEDEGKAGGGDRREGESLGEDSRSGGSEDRELGPHEGMGRETRFTKEEAERLLEALAGDERNLLGERMKSRVRRKGVEKNW